MVDGGKEIIHHKIMADHDKYNERRMWIEWWNNIIYINCTKTAELYIKLLTYMKKSKLKTWNSPKVS